jgi:CheY-like chemotaxis protein
MTKKDDNFQTRPLDQSHGTPMPRRQSGPLAEMPWVIELRVVGTASVIPVQISDKIIIGRNDPDRGVSCDVDLTPYGAFTHGVSRRHALITVKDNRISIKDLESTNGTRLNDYDLLPNEEYRLQHGDELTIGQLRLQVRFNVVPVHEPPTEGAPQAAPASVGNASQIQVVGMGEHILVIEDDENVAPVFRRALEQAGYTTMMATTAINALDFVAQRMPDAVILDLTLPEVTGLELLRYIRRHSAERHIPLLVITAMAGGFHTEKAREAGADIMLTKPVSVEGLVQSLSEALAKAR